MNDLTQLRNSLDNLDSALIAILAERFKITHTIGQYKRDNQLPPVDARREAEQMVRIAAKAETVGLDPKFAQTILRTIIDEVVRNHRAMQ